MLLCNGELCQGLNLDAISGVQTYLSESEEWVGSRYQQGEKKEGQEGMWE